MAVPQTFSFLFTDIEGSTRRWETQPDEMRVALARHDALVRKAVGGTQGRVFKAIGDAFCVVFASPAQALEGALAIQRALSAESWGAVGPIKVRAAVHVGAAEERDDDFFGPVLNRVARLLAVGHGGQTLLSRAAADAVADALPTGVSLRDLGERQLKDLSRRERVFQVVAPGLPQEFPPLRTLEARPNNLPAQATGLVGRESEAAQVRWRLRDPGTRLVTLTGPGGAGKTRLALQAAADLLDEYPQGAWFVPLAAITDPARVLPAVAMALGVKQNGDSLERTLEDYLRDRRVLLVLDNFEQVLDAAAPAAALLEAAPGLKLLTTSRSRLGVYGETVYDVPPLPEPEAVRLFLERAEAAGASAASLQDRAEVAALCAQLDGLPLAIELAAARSRLFSPKSMRAELKRSLEFLGGGARNLPERQRSLRGAIAWSHELLDERERAAFRRLGVFRGGWDRDAAESVLDDPGMVAVLASLTDKSLVRARAEGEETRFEMLETLREFAREQLEKSGEAEAYRRRHSAYFQELGACDGARLTGPDQRAWSERLEREQDNFCAALEFAEAAKDGEADIRLAAELGPFWNHRGRYREGRDRLETALSLSSAASKFRASAALSLARMHFGLGDIPRALSRIEEAVTLFRAQGDAAGDVEALNLWTWVLMHGGNVDRAEVLTRELLEKSARLNDPRLRAVSLERSAYLAQERGHPELAGPMLEEALALAEKAGDINNASMLLNVLGEDARAAGDIDKAARFYQRSQERAREARYAHGIAVAAHNLAVCRLRQGRPAEALPLAIESLAAAHAVGNRRLAPPELILFAALVEAAGDAAEAAVYVGAAEKILKENGSVLVYADRGEYDETLRALREKMEPAAFDSARAAGSALTYCDAVDRALALAPALRFPTR